MHVRPAALLLFVAPLALTAAEPDSLTFSETLKLPPLSLSDLANQPTPARPFTAPSPTLVPRTTPPLPVPRKLDSSKLPLVEPDSSVDYKMVIVPPKPGVDYRMAIKVPASPETEPAK